jgi:hypothetical protein
MHNLKPTVILRKHGKRITEPRIRLLGYLINNPKAHTLSEIEERFGSQIDRVTIYRSLKIFISIGVVMKFINSKDRRYPVIISNALINTKLILHSFTLKVYVRIVQLRKSNLIKRSKFLKYQT